MIMNAGEEPHAVLTTVRVVVGLENVKLLKGLRKTKTMEICVLGLRTSGR